MMLTSLFLAVFTLMQLNCENLFDCRHDSLKNDLEFLPDGERHWTPYRYWKKLNQTARTIIACGETDNGEAGLPDLVALCEVENDSVMEALTRRSLLRHAHYQYLVTRSPDSRGIDVALLYHYRSFAPIRHTALSVDSSLIGYPTRDILYVEGRLKTGDTLHLMVVHAPSRRGGEAQSRPHRMAVAQRLLMAADSIRERHPEALIVMAGDFNDLSSDPAIRYLAEGGMEDVSQKAVGRKNGVEGTYRYQGVWGSIDHILVSAAMRKRVVDVAIHDADFLLEEDERYGGFQPRRTFKGYRYQEQGFSDHLPLIMHFK